MTGSKVQGEASVPILGMTWQSRPDLEYDKIEAIWIEIFIPKSRPVLICFMYRPPDTSKYLNQDF